MNIQKIVPHLWFDKEAREAAEFYCSIFPDSKITSSTFLKNTPSGEVEVVNFILQKQVFQAISAGPFFKFNESISLMVYCDNQEEIDYYFAKLSAVPEAEQCGWIKDKYGLSWQIVPTIMNEMMTCGDEEKIAALTQAFLPMKKLNIQKLKEVFQETRGKSTISPSNENAK